MTSTSIYKISKLFDASINIFPKIHAKHSLKKMQIFSFKFDKKNEYFF